MTALLGHRESKIVWADIERARQEAWDAARQDSHAHPLVDGSFRGWTTYGVWVNKADPSADLDWFGQRPWEYQGKLFLPPKHNLCVNSGIHIALQRTFLTTAGGALTPVASSTIGGVRCGGVDNDVTAVSATTARFNTTAGNRFITIFDANPTYSTANKRMTALFNITNSDTTIVHRRYGIIGDGTASDGTDNEDFTLFSMLSGFELNFNSLAYDITVESQSNGTGS